MLNIVVTLKLVFVYGNTVVKIGGLFADKRQLKFFWHTFPDYFCKARLRKRSKSHFGKYLDQGWG